MKRMIHLGLVLVIFGSLGFSHGLEIDVRLDSPVVIVQIGYSEHDHLASGRIVITGPEPDRVEYQTGTPDAEGRFVFMPDRPGVWTLVVDDGTGHRTEKTIEITPEFFAPPESSPASTAAVEVEHSSWGDMPMGIKIIVGLALIFGLSGIFFGLKAAGLRKKSQDNP